MEAPGGAGELCPACTPASPAGLDDMMLSKRRRILHSAPPAAPCEPECSAEQMSEPLRPSSPVKEEECPPAPPSPRADLDGKAPAEPEGSCNVSPPRLSAEAAAAEEAARQRADLKRQQAEARAARQAEEQARRAAGMALMGRRLELYSAEEGGWYRGRVAQFSAKTGRHTVRCDNGAIEALSLEGSQHRWVDAAAPFSPMLIPDSDGAA